MGQYSTSVSGLVTFTCEVICWCFHSYKNHWKDSQDISFPSTLSFFVDLFEFYVFNLLLLVT